MAIALRTGKKEACALVLWDGVVGADDFLAHVGRLCSHADWPPSDRLHLADLRIASLDASMDRSTLERAAELYGKHQDKIARMRAAIVARDAFEKAVEFERLISQYGATVIVFNRLDTACTWLGISGDEVERTLQQLRNKLRGATKAAKGSQ